jgi:hypothetical protein
MPRGPQKRLEVTKTAELLSALAEWAGPTLYLSRGYGPRPPVRAAESPDYVRVALIPAVPFAEVQAARARWLAEAAALGPVEDGEIDPVELAAPAADSRWTTVAAETRAEALTRGIAALQQIRPELAVFHLTARSGGAVLLPSVRASATGEEPPLALTVLDHVLYGALTHRSLRFSREALVVAEGSTWSIRQVFPDHAAVWQAALIEAPAQALGGLSFARLGELLVRVVLARRTGSEAPASAPAIAAALAAAEAVIAPWLSNLLGEGDRPPARN